MSKYLQLEHSSHSYTTREADPESDWDRDDSATDWYIGDVVRIISQKDYDSEPIDFEVKSGDKVYVLYAIWSTGDSFGHDARSQFDVINYWSTEAKAVEAKRVLEESKTYGAFDIVLESGKVLPYYVAWNGYFESLDELVVKEVTVA